VKSMMLGTPILHAAAGPLLATQKNWVTREDAAANTFNSSQSRTLVIQPISSAATGYSPAPPFASWSYSLATQLSALRSLPPVWFPTTPLI
jgi:hypothetical protein